MQVAQNEIDVDESALLVQEISRIRADLAMDCYASFYVFFKTFWHILSSRQLVDNWHIEYLCDIVQDKILEAIAGVTKPNDLIINVPPGSTKSSIITEAAPIWIWLRQPSFTVINTSYSSGLSVDHAMKSKDIFKSDLFNELFQPLFQKLYGKHIYLTKDSMINWKNNFGGERQTTSTGGTITGKHADIQLVDDSLSVEQASSEAEVKTCHRFHDTTLPSRFKDQNTGLTIYIMQRLLEDDTTGHQLRKGLAVDHICLPGEISEEVRPKPESLAKYYVNNLLDPVRLNRQVLDRYKLALGSYGYAGQILQDPTPPGGGKIKEKWILIAEERMREELIEWMIFVDGAYTENTENDPTGLFVCGVYQSVLYILYATSKFMEINELLVEIKSYFPGKGTKGLFPLGKAGKIYIEPKASGKTLKQLLTKDGYNAIEISSDLIQGGKLARCNVMIPYIEAGRVRLVKGAWNEEVIHQWTRFPKAIHDEYIDLGGYAVDLLLHKVQDGSEENSSVNPSEFY